MLTIFSYLEACVLYYPAPFRKAAITFVAHGLNLKPKAMEPLIHLLTNNGSEVYLIQLSGHFEKSKPIKDIDPALWKKEMLCGYDQAKKAAAKLGVPLYFLGYSLGALLGQSMILLPFEGRIFEKQILIAPAVAIRNRSFILKLLSFLGSNSVIPSMAPIEYRANDELPLSVYQLLFAEEKRLWVARMDQLNIPTLVIVDPKDELISYKRLVFFINSFELTNYQTLTLNTSLRGRRGRYHHLLLDQYTMGKENWCLVSSAIQQFLFNRVK